MAIRGGGASSTNFSTRTPPWTSAGPPQAPCRKGSTSRFLLDGDSLPGWSRDFESVTRGLAFPGQMGTRRYIAGMDRQPLLPPEGLRPAQLGVVLVGRVVLGHIGATAADLAARGYLRMEETDTGWVLADVCQPTVPGRGELLSYESELLAGLFDGPDEVRLSALGEPFLRTLDRVRRQVVRDAVRHGWLSRWRHETRTSRGERLLAEVLDFRRELRAAARGGNLPAGLLPYAMVFGVSAAAPLQAGATAGPPARRSEGEVPGASSPGSTAGYQTFATAWQHACSRVAADHGGHCDGGQGPDFAHQWSQPHHSPPVHDHDPGGTAYGGHHGSPGGHFGGHH